MAIEYLEKPRGCLETLRPFAERREVTISDVLMRTSLSQSCAYASLNHLAKLDLIARSTEHSTRRAPRRYKLTHKGKELLLPLSVFFDTLDFALGGRDILPHLAVPYRNLEVLILLRERGHVCHTELVEEEGMCKTTARSALQALKNLGLLRVEVKRNFRRTRKEYSLTETGQCVARALSIVDERLASLVKQNQPRRPLAIPYTGVR